MTMDIMKTGYMRYRHVYKRKEFSIYEHRLNLLLKYSLKEVLNGVCHHRNGCKLDNRIENLQLFKTKEEHHQHHAKNDVGHGQHKDYDNLSYVEKYKKGCFDKMTKYTLWNPHHVYYSKGHMMNKHNKGFRPVKCFKVRCNGKFVEIGEQLDFVTCEIIHDLISLYAEEEVV